jgi:hypothetical protein
MDLLAEAIDLLRQVLNQRPLGHPHRSSSLKSLANALTIQFRHLGDLNSLAEAVDLHRQTLELLPMAHSDRALSLSSLANALTIQFRQIGNLNLLAEAVGLHRQALDLRLREHLGRSVHRQPSLGCSTTVCATAILRSMSTTVKTPWHSLPTAVVPHLWHERVTAVQRLLGLTVARSFSTSVSQPSHGRVLSVIGSCSLNGYH